MRGFSLAELVVSIGVLLLMFSLAGQVFTLTMKSTGQAKAFTRINQLLRIFEDTLREDLRNVEPGQSVMLIQANPVNAYWTSAGLEADDDGDPATGYPHTSDPQREDAAGNMIAPRADMLMFFTSRKGTSYVDPGVTANLQQVVYGHAELGEYAVGGVWEPHPKGPFFPIDEATDYASPTVASKVPARQWHLGRRSVQLVPVATATPSDNPPGKTLTTAVAGGFGDDRFLQSEFDVLGDFVFEDLAIAPGMNPPWYLPSSVLSGFGAADPRNPVRRSQLDSTPPAILRDRLGHYFIPNCASFKVEWTLDPRSEFVSGRLDDMTELLWFDQGRFDPDAETDPDKRYEHPLGTLHEAVDTANFGSTVERNLRSLLSAPTVHPNGDTYSLSDRFRGRADVQSTWTALAPAVSGVRRPNLVAFGVARRDVDDEIVPEDIFPGALRITIDLYDDTRRLDRPIRHVMIIPVGG